MQDLTNGTGSFYDQVKNYGYINGKQYTDVNEFNKAGGSGLFDTGSNQSFGNTAQNNGGGVTAPSSPTIDLQGLYQKLYDQSGVSAAEQKVTDAQNGFNKAQSQINDNPFLSEGNRTGRIAKLQTDFNNDTSTLKNDVVTKKADIQTQLDLATKQFDINSNQAKQSLDQFNTLLSNGALDNASPQDIANITRSTGLSSTMITNAINASKAKNVKTQTIQFDDGTHQGFAIIDQNGNILNKQVIANSKPTKTSSTAETKSDVGSSISDYYNNRVVTINGRTGHIRTIISPEDFYNLLTQQFPGQLASIPKPAAIRKITGQ